MPKKTFRSKKARTTTSSSRRTVKKSKPKKKSLQIKAFQQAIGRKFQSIGEEKRDVPDRKNRAKGRREGL